MKQLVFLICLLFMLIPNVWGKAFTILIDPGHGGEDEGATRKIVERMSNGKTKVRYVFEKDLTLEIAQKIYSKLKKKYHIYMTRSVDRAIELTERASLADKVQADLFISVHINSTRSKKSHGFETYYLDNHSDKAVKKVENTENMVFKGADQFINKILLDLVIERTVVHSKKLAGLIHGNLSKTLRRRPYRMSDRGIKPGLFYVLALSKRPAVLLEVGFMSNQKEFQKISSIKFQDAYANAVAKAVDKYFETKRSRQLSLF